MDDNRIITSWNKGAEDIFGWKEEEVVGRSVRIIAPDDMAESQERNLCPG